MLTLSRLTKVCSQTGGYWRPGAILSRQSNLFRTCHRSAKYRSRQSLATRPQRQHYFLQTAFQMLCVISQAAVTALVNPAAMLPPFDRLPATPGFNVPREVPCVLLVSSCGVPVEADRCTRFWRRERHSGPRAPASSPLLSCLSLRRQLWCCPRHRQGRCEDNVVGQPKAPML